MATATNEKNHVPNSFQMPNAFIDEYEHLLTSDEFKVLAFVTRRILGFYNSRGIRRNRISLSQICGEIKAKNKNGEIVTVSHGVGLGRPTVIKCLKSLADYKFVMKIGDPTENGQEFELNVGNIEPIDLSAMLEAKNVRRLRERAKFDKREKTKQQKKMPTQLMALTTKDQNSLVNAINQPVNGINQQQNIDNHSNLKAVTPENDAKGVVNGINTLKQTIETNKEETNNSADFKCRKIPGDRQGLKFEERDLAGAKWMYEQLQNQNPNFKPPSFPRWANEIRLMREQDKRTYKEIADLWTWARQDSFWMSNILSPRKLREKWEQLWMKMNAPKPIPKNGHANGSLMNGKKVVAPWEIPWNPLNQKGLVPDAATIA